MLLSIILSLVSSCIVGVLSSQHTNQTANYHNLTVAVVRAPPANWPLPLISNTMDRSNGVQGCWSYQTSSRQRCQPRCICRIMVPGVRAAIQCHTCDKDNVDVCSYSKGIADNVSIAGHIKNYVENSLTVDNPQWNRLVFAAKNNAVYVVPGFSHREGNQIYMAQTLISPKGELLYLRHKSRPSGGERTTWSDGTLNEWKSLRLPTVDGVFSNAGSISIRQ